MMWINQNRLRREPPLNQIVLGAELRASQAMLDGDAWQMICVNMAARCGKQGFEDGMVMKPYSSR
jgi:hypothetical protein